MKQHMSFSARVIADSISPACVRLTTIEVTFPRIVLAEFNTHRMFSRNSASSRAIPVEKMLAKVKEDPFSPVYWGKNQKGMQAEKELTPEEQEEARYEWLHARDYAIYEEEKMLALGIHKQITNRLLEPWLWHTVIVTATEWDNFWGLRCDPMAQPEIKYAAEMMRTAFLTSTPSVVDYGDWHLPLIEPSEVFDLLVSGMSIENVCKVSIGRCARVSYLTHDGKRDPKADIELCERLEGSGHMSPLEHAARPMGIDDAEKAILAIPGVKAVDRLDIDVTKMFSGNFRGWVQARKMVAYEDNFLARPKA
jgi:thymidylate synthase ThyX